MPALGGGGAREAQLRALAEAAVTARVFPGAVVGIIRGGQTTVLPVGGLTYEPGAPKVTADTVYDAASVTKSVRTSSLTLKLIEDGRLALDDLVVKYLPEMVHPSRANMLIRHLLTYTVVPDLPTGLATVARDAPSELLEVILNSPLKAPPGTLYHYTNSPAVLLGLVIERVTGRALDTLAQEWLFEPLGMTRSTFHPLEGGRSEAGPRGLIAPTEFDGVTELRGVVHDETARELQAQGIMAGCAGLFTTAPDLLRFAHMLLAGGTISGRQYFARETILRMRSNQLGSIGQTAGLGWEIDRPDVMGKAQRDGMMMKSGFTGCWIAVDPARSLALVLLSNRTYPHRPEREPFNTFLRSLNEAFFLEQ